MRGGDSYSPQDGEVGHTQLVPQELTVTIDEVNYSSGMK